MSFAALFLIVAQLTGQAQAPVPEIVSQAPVKFGSSVAFHALLVPDTVYLGQQATYQIAVFLDDRVRARMRRNPEFVPPELRSLVAYDLPAGASRMYQREVGGKVYEVHVFERALFGLTDGAVQIPPAQLLYSLPLSASFFSREESHALSSERVLLTVREPPLAGRPVEYAGAIGVLALDARFDSRTGRTGDPFVLTVGVRGEANVAHLPRPSIEVPWGTAVPASERVRLDSSAIRVTGRKEFDWILTPRDSGVLKLPPVRYWFFNPVAERYELAVAQPESLTVRSATLAIADTAASASTFLSIRTTFRGEKQPPVTDRPWFWILAIAAPIPALGGWLAAAWHRRRRPQRAERVLRSLSRHSQVDAARVRRAYVLALAERLLIPAETLTRRGELARMLRLSGVRPETARDADDLLAELDEAIYANVPHGASTQAGRRAFDIVRNVDREAIRKVMLMALAACVFGAVTPLEAGSARDLALRQAFDRGVMQYANREFGASLHSFAEVASQAPRSPDAWANVGTAGFAASDTAAAAVGWQRALRLEPRSTDVRDRIALLGTTDRGFVSMMPPITSGELALLSLMFWIALWALLALPQRRPIAIAPVVLLSLFGGVMAAGAAAGGVRELESGVRMAVVAEGGLLRTLPALGADRGATVLTGEVARTRARRGVWTRVELDGGRTGWVETQRLVPLGG